MKCLKAMLCLVIGYGLSASVYANEADTFSQCTQSSLFGGQWMSSSFFNTCLLSPNGTAVIESRIEQTKNYFPINYALKFVNGSSATIRLSLIDEKYCKNPSEEVMLRANQEFYSGRTCVFLKSHRGIAIEVVAKNWAPSVLRARRRLISSFRFQINSFYCTSFVQHACSSSEYLSVRFWFDEDSLDWASSNQFDFLSHQSQTWRLPTEMP